MSVSQTWVTCPAHWPMNLLLKLTGWKQHRLASCSRGNVIEAEAKYSPILWEFTSQKNRGYFWRNKTYITTNHEVKLLNSKGPFIASKVSSYTQEKQ